MEERVTIARIRKRIGRRMAALSEGQVRCDYERDLS
jgi:hypothetical protein